MSSSRGKDVALIIGLLIPVAMILFIAGAIYLPRAFTRVDPPQCDFLYMIGYPKGQERVFVRDGRLVREEVDAPEHAPPHSPHEIRFFVHHVADNVSERVSFERASELTLDNTPTSPDGFDIVYGRKADFFFPIASSTDYRTRYLKKESHTTKLDLSMGPEGDFFASFIFLGWIIEEAEWTS